LHAKIDNALKNIKFKQKIILVFFGLLSAFIVIEIGLRLGGGAFLAHQEYKNLQSISQKKDFKILCLGESTTALGRKYSYPNQLEDILNQKRPDVRVAVINKGIPKTTTTQIVAHLERNLKKYNPDIVITMMGINDVDFFSSPYSGKIQLFRSYRLLRMVIQRLQKAENRDATQANQKSFSIQEGTFLRKPQNAKKLIMQGIYYSKKHNYKKAVSCFKRVLAFDPKNVEALEGLGRCALLGEHNHAKANYFFFQAFELHPHNIHVLLGLAWTAQEQKKYDKAIYWSNKALEIDPSDKRAVTGLIRAKLQKKQYKATIQRIEKYMHNYKADDFILRSLAFCYLQTGQHEHRKNILRQVKEIEDDGYNKTTSNNYLALAQKLKARKIVYVCVQYPNRSIEPLKDILEGENVIFVDNESIFAEAIQNSSYEKYFYDTFGGDFGHCTQQGNRLLAENIAGIVLEKLFNNKSVKH